MNKTTHRVLTTISLSLTGVTGLLAATNPSGLGVGAHTWAFTCLGFSVLGLVVQAVRQAFDAPDLPPNITNPQSGVGVPPGPTP